MQKMGIQIFVEGPQPTIIGLLAGFVTVIVCELSQAVGVENKNMVKLATILRLSSAQNPDVIWCHPIGLYIGESRLPKRAQTAKTLWV